MNSHLSEKKKENVKRYFDLLMLCIIFCQFAIRGHNNLLIASICLREYHPLRNQCFENCTVYLIYLLLKLTAP